MLKFMRTHATSWLIKIVLGAIVIVFVFWGVGTFRAQRSSRVASVNDEIITEDDYREAYNNLLEQFRGQFGKNLDSDTLEMLQIESRALDALINKALILQKAEELHFRVSDQELTDAIAGIEAFKNNGVFDNKRYRNILTANRLTPEGFEQSQRNQMLVEKVQAFIVDHVKISEAEAQEWYGWKNASVDLSAVLFEPSSYSDVSPSEDELKAYFERNQDRYKTDLKFRARYVVFKPESYKERIQISDERIQEYYQLHPEEFEVPKTVEARHILFKVSESASEEKAEATYQRAMEIYEKAKAGEDFSQLAKTYSEGPTKDEGGYLGPFRRESMVKPFSDAAFSMGIGDISTPVRTRFGWHIIKVEKIHEASARSIEDASSDIQKKLSERETRSIAYDDAENFFDYIFDSETFAEEAQARKIKISTTEFFSQAEPPLGVPEAKRFADAAFGLPMMEVSDILDFKDGYYLIQPVERLDPQVPEMDAVIERLTEDWKKEKGDEKALQEAESFLKQLKAGGSLEELSEQFGVKTLSTGFFKRNETIPNIGYEREILLKAFELNRDNPFTDEVIKGRKGYYVIGFNDRKPVDMEKFEADKQDTIDMVRRQKTNMIFEQWLERIKRESEIIIEKEIS